MAARMLTKMPRNQQGFVDPTVEVLEVMAVFPISLRAKLQSTLMRSSADLQQILNQMEKELVHAFYNKHNSEGRSAHAMTEEEMAPIVDRVRAELKQELRKQIRTFNDHSSSRRAMAAEWESEDEDGNPVAEDNPVIAEAFAVIRSNERRNRSVHPVFAKADSVRTPLKRKPLSPCRNCGSRFHWDRECPNNAAFKLMKKAKLAQALETDRPPEQKDLYSKLYDTLVAQSNASAYVAFYSPGPSPAEDSHEPARKHAHKVTVEEIEDEDEFELPAMTSKASAAAAPSVQVIQIALRRTAPAGRSAQGISVLSVKGHLNSLDEAELDLRLDSGADIMLISDEFYRSLKTPPQLRKGTKMSLWQLVDKNASIQGYVEINLYIPSSQGPTLQSLAEVYIVPGMAVPILLGEDFQRTYKVNMTRDVSSGCNIRFGGTSWTVKAQDIDRRGKTPKLARNTTAEASFVRAKTSRRVHAARQRKNRDEHTRTHNLRLTAAVTVPPQSVVNAEVALLADLQREWLVEKALIHAGPEAKIAIPNCLVTVTRLRISISNPTNEAITLAQGTLVGVLTDPAAFFDTPKDLKHLENMLKGAAKVAAVAEVMDKVYEQPGQLPDPSAEPATTEAYHADSDPRMSSYAIPPVEDDGP